jgi:hypothetical protein
MGLAHRRELKRDSRGDPLKIPLFFSLSTEGGKREEEKMYLGTPQTPASLPDRKSVREKTTGLITCREGFYAPPAFQAMTGNRTV